MLEKTKGIITNEQLRNTDNMRHTRHRAKTTKTQKRNTKILNDEQHGPHQKTRGEP